METQTPQEEIARKALNNVLRHLGEEPLGEYEDARTIRCINPDHEDENASMSVYVSEGGSVNLDCKSGGKRGGCHPKKLVEYLPDGLIPSDLWKPAKEGTKRPGFRVVGTYPYYDADGALMYEAVRYEHPTKEKDFAVRHRLADGTVKWKHKNKKRTLYNLRAVMSANLVYVCEGEEAVHAMTERGLPATTMQGGTGAGWSDELSKLLAGAVAVKIIADNDAAGFRHAAKVKASLLKVVAAVVVRSQTEGPKDDAVEHFAAGGNESTFQAVTYEELEAALGNSVEPAEEPGQGPEAGSARIIGPSMSAADILAKPQLRRPMLIERFLPAAANVLIAAHGKTFKTFMTLHAAVAMVLGRRFLGEFNVPRQHRVGFVAMEGSELELGERVDRICQDFGVSVQTIGDLHLWHQPPLRLSDDVAIEQLGDAMEILDLDFMFVDNWMYVSDGDSNSADEVLPQLMNFASIKKRREGSGVGLVHHSKQGAKAGERMSEVIRGSTGFGGWYDLGIMMELEKGGEAIKVTTEARNYPPLSLRVTVEDEHEPSAAFNFQYGGYFRMRTTDHDPVREAEEAEARELEAKVFAFLSREENHGCSKSKVEDAKLGPRGKVRETLLALTIRGAIEVREKSNGRGSEICVIQDLAEPRQNPSGEVLTGTSPTSPPSVGGGECLAYPDGGDFSGPPGGEVPSPPSDPPAAPPSAARRRTEFEKFVDACLRQDDSEQMAARMIYGWYEGWADGRAFALTSKQFHTLMLKTFGELREEDTDEDGRKTVWYSLRVLEDDDDNPGF